MTPLPVIVGFGGINAAGRSSHHHAYHRLVLGSLPRAVAERAVRSLSRLMALDGALAFEDARALVEAGTLVRRIEPTCYDVDRVSWHRRIDGAGQGGVSFVCAPAALPRRVPPHWRVTGRDDGRVTVAIADAEALFVPDVHASPVKSAGQLPSGFAPGARYASHHHPRGLRMAVFGVSDAVQSMGLDWELIRRRVPPAAIGVYAGAAMGQLDAEGTGGMLSARLVGRAVTPKLCPLGFPQMTADFINAYVLGSVGRTGASLGACASFLYNLAQAVLDIQCGRVRVAVVGSSEAPITPEVVEGYAAMGALATEDKLLALAGDPHGQHVDWRRSCRPFSTNCGFVVGESAQFLVLFDDALAVELGATIHGAVNDVFINADGYKKSIAAPGIGNYITFASAVASVRALLGDDSLRRRSYVQAHGSGTPQNRVTESHILDATAAAFGIDNWPVSAVKCYLGHSIGTAAGDQIAASLGVWDQGLIPGIGTIDHVAADVHAARLVIGPTDLEVGREGMDVAFVNAKGFGGNNASTAILAPHRVRRMLARRHGRQSMDAHAARNEAVLERSTRHRDAVLAGTDVPIYRFGEGVLDGDDIRIRRDGIDIAGCERAIAFAATSRYADMVE